MLHCDIQRISQPNSKAFTVGFKFKLIKYAFLILNHTISIADPDQAVGRNVRRHLPLIIPGIGYSVGNGQKGGAVVR